MRESRMMRRKSEKARRTTKKMRKSDIYNFAMVILELVAGKHLIDPVRREGFGQSWVHINSRSMHERFAMNMMTQFDYDSIWQRIDSTEIGGLSKAAGSLWFTLAERNSCMGRTKQPYLEVELMVRETNFGYSGGDSCTEEHEN
ncbi:hypothetical protein Scep_004262 [Stephania cephalantha]|uniref:Serine-threonine/tyrosine-protein kinase catalytic domain-containing protein n=1 Tax=Stephania cephalantha TaxID=152367 RepID=A0AAP0PV91_9MAGN